MDIQESEMSLQILYKYRYIYLYDVAFLLSIWLHEFIYTSEDDSEMDDVFDDK